MLAVLGVGVTGSIQYFEDETSDEVRNQADCLSDRPPPPSCQPASLAPPPPTSLPSDDDGGETEPNPEVELFPPTVLEVDLDGDEPEVELLIEVVSLDTPPVDLDDVRVTIAVTITASDNPSQVGDRFFGDCELESDGMCQLKFEVPSIDVTEVSVEVVTIGTELPYDFAAVAALVISTTATTTTTTSTTTTTTPAP